jgi:hypothetical protein
MNKKLFNKLKDVQKKAALDFFTEEVNNKAIQPSLKDSYSMGYEAGLSFALSLVNDYLKDEDGNVQDQK